VLDRFRHNAGEHHFPLTGRKWQINVMMLSRVEQPISHAEQNAGIQKDAQFPGNTYVSLRPSQRAGGDDQQDQDGKRKKEKPGPEKESYEKGDDAGENDIRETPC